MATDRCLVHGNELHYDTRSGFDICYECEREKSVNPPAADAGPRCEQCKVPMVAVGTETSRLKLNCGAMTAKRDWRQMGWKCKTCNAIVAAAPPVPQEAAPRPDYDWCPVCGNYSCVDAKCSKCGRANGYATATAPDSAMRVAEQIITNFGRATPSTSEQFKRHVGEVAALIREAGSERERELRPDVQQFASWMSAAMDSKAMERDSR